MSYDPNTQSQPTTPLPPFETQSPANPYQQPTAAGAYQTQVPRTAPPTTLGYTNTFAVISVILAFIMPIVGIIFGHMGLSQIKRNGDAGRGLALTGLIVGYAYLAMIALLVITYIGMFLVMFASLGAFMGNGFDSLGYYDSDW